MTKEKRKVRKHGKEGERRICGEEAWRTGREGGDEVSESLNVTSPTGGGVPTKTSSDLQIPDR